MMMIVDMIDVLLTEHNFVFNNGCRAPLVRQLHGDIGYLVVKPHDGDEIQITASTNGYFVNKVGDGPLDNGPDT